MSTQRDDDPRARALRYSSGADDGSVESADEVAPATQRGRRPEDQALWVDQQIRAAIARGEFDDLPLAGKPLPRSVSTHDPDWWVKQLIERERITGVLPPALALRREDAELDALLDATGSEERVRELIDDFNRRVVEARRQLQGGPPVVTATRDVEAEVQAWQERRRHRVEAARLARAEPHSPPPRRRWWRRG